MDAVPEDQPFSEPVTLSYDEDTAYEEQLPAQPALADRIGRTKVYLLSDTSASRAAKRKRGDDNGDIEAEAEAEMEVEDTSHRGNALLLQGSPIAHLPTERIFAYATHFDAIPMGLEWVDDTTCVLVFESNTRASAAIGSLRKTTSEYPDDEGFVTAKPVPMAFWPPEERINASLGMGEGLKGTVRMRWAVEGDVKKKGARKESEFYKKHGLDAGKVGERRLGEEGERGSKRRRRDEGETRAQLDDDLDAFLREDSPEASAPSSPPSKMRSDYIGEGKSLLERTSSMRSHDGDRDSDMLASRITARLPRRARQRGPREEPHWRESEPAPRRSRGDGGARRSQPRDKKSQQELDDELDAFLNDRT
ncbi:hypothetical protein BV25DRAFT_1896149 [Artomyces pyxidatus]|uniref:Uncharacterized protein n=1 Tax=Artomyces pyxidatus TaxID=48021 RepID=A0ACB8TKX8_9AGAM|nr:hypothetical protein BV25DRAFT_1896149 [Artomyces pyxidatus]